MKLDYDLIERIRATHYYTELGLELKVTYYKVDDNEVYYWDSTDFGWRVSAFQYGILNMLTEIHPHVSDSDEYVKTQYNTASQALADFENGVEEFYHLAKDNRFYKLTTEPSICKGWVKGKLYTRKEKSFEDKLEDFGHHVGKDKETGLYTIDSLSEKELVQLAKDVLKAAGEQS